MIMKMDFGTNTLKKNIIEITMLFLYYKVGHFLSTENRKKKIFKKKYLKKK